MANPPLCARHPKLQNVRVIVDCFEVFPQRPKNLGCPAKTFSTLKVLIGISPAGFITFVSEDWGERASDKYMTLCSDLVDMLEQGDVVLTNRGVTVTDELTLYGERVITPAFFKTAEPNN